jgi:hypothetical protein
VRAEVVPDGEACLIGRDPGCDLVVDDARVSRRHARLEPVASGWRLVDLGSKNGTQIDGLPPDDRPVADRAWMSLGGLPVRFDRISARQLEREASRDRERRQTSLELRRRLDPAAGLAALLDRLLASVLAVTAAERAGVVLSRPDGEIALAAAAGAGADELAALAPGATGRSFQGSRSAMRHALERGEPVAVSDTWSDHDLSARSSVAAGGIRALVCLPLAVLGRTLGVLYADSRRPGSWFRELDVEILEALAAQAALAIGVARHHDEVASLRGELPTLLGAGPEPGAGG